MSLTGDKIQKILEELGIETYIIFYNDPDSDQVSHLFKGRRVWAIGATEIVREQIMRDYLEKP